ncbi:hypothetical protein BSKO_09401 [Bryopsis sp. KO-2023]|nr:hypothetical protein BSKO_09401 [Bryopsis sp. KO-2023]
MDYRQHLEEEFWKWWWVTTVSRRVVTGAVVAGPVFIILIPLFVGVLGFRPLPLFLLGYCGVEKLVVYFALCNKPDFYKRCGGLALFACRVGGTITIAYVGSQFGELAGSHTAGADLTLLAMLIVNLVAQPFLCTVSFRVHLLAQALSASTAAAFVLPLCDRCFVDRGWKTFFGKVERVMDEFGTSLVRLGESNDQQTFHRMTNPSRNPCRRLMSFAVLWVGWVLPSVAAYLDERAARLVFVRRSMLAYGYTNFNGGKAPTVAILMWIVNLIVFFELSWRFLKAF